MGVGTLQVGNPALGTVSRQPQTTATPSAGKGTPFARLSRKMQIAGPSQSGLSFGALWTPSLRAAGGYLRYAPLTILADNGSGTGASFTDDAPYNVVQNMYLRDPFGTLMYQCDGWNAHLIDMYSGQMGMLGFGNLESSLPSWTALSADGKFQLTLKIPFELDSSGYCSLPSMNAASQPNLNVQLNPSATVYATAPSATVPTITLNLREQYWGAPIDQPELAPPDVGSSAQWSVARVQAGVQSGSFQRLQLPRVGTLIHTLILTLRDSTGKRIDAWPTSDLQLWVDGVPFLFETLVDRADEMYRQFGVARPTGVIVYSFRDSVQSAVSSADTYDSLLNTTPATLLEVVGTFGTISSGPGYIDVATGELYPKGGIPYNHLAS